MSPQIRRPTPAELPQVAEVNLSAFGERLDAWHQKWFANRAFVERTVVAVDGSRVVGCALWFPIDLGVPGGRSPAAAISAVAVLPTHRRRGLMRRMIDTLLADIAERGLAITALQASEGALYPRFGFGPAAHSLRVSLERPRVRVAAAAGRGSLELIDSGAAHSLLPPLHDRLVRARPGIVARDRFAWEQILHGDHSPPSGEASALFHVLHRQHGRADGYALYRIHPRWSETGPVATLAVLEMVALTPAAATDLWRHCLEMDLVQHVEAVEPGARRPVDDPILWVSADPQAVRASLATALWLRLGDPPAALQQRRYQVDGELSFRLTDGPGGPGADALRLTVSRGRARCYRSAAPADLTLTTGDLATAYLGEPTLAALARAGRVRERRPGAARAADRLLRWDPPPWCFEDL